MIKILVGTEAILCRRGGDMTVVYVAKDYMSFRDAASSGRYVAVSEGMIYPGDYGNAISAGVSIRSNNQCAIRYYENIDERGNCSDEN